MATPVPARLTAAEGRRFGFRLGAAFLAFGGLLWWRGRAGAPGVLIIGLALLLAAVAIPGRLGPIRRAWLGLGAAISPVTTPIFLGVVYFGAILPIGLLLRARGRNPLTRYRSLSSCWVPRPVEARSRRDMERQF